MFEVIYRLQARRRSLLLAALAVAVVGFLSIIVYSQPTTHAAEPPDDCWGGVLSEDPLQCYVVDEAHREGVIEVEGLYEDGVGSLYIFFKYLREVEVWLTTELYDYLQQKGLEFVEKSPDQLSYYPNYADEGIDVATQSSSYDVVLFRPGGAEARRQVGGWGTWTQVWPRTSSKSVDYTPATFDVSDVDVTNFPELDCAEQRRQILRPRSCDAWKRHPELGIAGWYGNGKPTYVQVKAPPGKEENIDAAREELIRVYGPENDANRVFIPVKYDFEELWRWSVVLDRFAVSSGNTIGIRGARVSPNIGSSATTLFPLDNLKRTSYENSDQTRETISVSALDEQRVAAALPVLLPQLGIPVDAVGVITRFRDGPPVVAVPSLPLASSGPRDTGEASNKSPTPFAEPSQNGSEERTRQAEDSPTDANLTSNMTDEVSPSSTQSSDSEIKTDGEAIGQVEGTSPNRPASVEHTISAVDGAQGNSEETTSAAPLPTNGGVSIWVIAGIVVGGFFALISLGVGIVLTGRWRRGHAV